MHNNIMAAGSRDRPLMLATGRYAQWHSRFLRYIDTRPNGDALEKAFLEWSIQPTTVTIPAYLQQRISPAKAKKVKDSYVHKRKDVAMQTILRKLLHFKLRNMIGLADTDEEID
ncbi:hypothetical protein Tco_0756005 [Tanacetum coccineum]